MLTRLKRAFLICFACASAAQAIDIQFDYSFDTSGFFSGGNLGRRSILESAATLFETRLDGTTWTAITPDANNTWTITADNPATGNALSIANPIQGANTLTIYVGARDLSGGTLGLASTGYSISGFAPWFDLFDSKDSNTHFEPINGSISFDSLANWYFDLDTSTAESFAGQFDFFSVVQHEIGHLLGFSDGNNAFSADISGGTFVGVNAMAVYGGAIPLSGDQSHWSSGLTFNGKTLTMNPALPSNTRTMFSDLEFAVLQDIGYQLAVDSGELTINVDAGKGSVTGSLSGVTQQEIGAMLSVTATAKAGFRFTGWTGDITSSANPLQFTMADGLELTANFVALPFRIGNFYGIFAGGTSAETNGNWRFSVTVAGRLSGVLYLNGQRVQVRGELDLNGHLSATLLNGSISLSMDQDSITGDLSGTLTRNAVVATFSGKGLPVYSSANPSPLRGHYTVVFQAESPAPTPLPPQGSGFGVIAIGVSGQAQFSGQLANGTRYSIGAPLNADDQLAFSGPLNRTLEFLNGSLNFPGQSPNDLDGDVSWTRADSGGVGPWGDGFTTTLSALGSQWIKPARTRVLSGLNSSLGAGTLNLTLGALTLNTPITVSLRNGILELPPTANSLRLSVATSTGILRGTYLDTSVGPVVRRSFLGVFLQAQDRAEGYTLDLSGSGQSAKVSLLPDP